MIRIEILDTFEMGGELLASVKADTLAFIGQGRRPFRTRFATIPYSELYQYKVIEYDEWGEEPCTCNPAGICMYCQGIYTREE